MSEQSMAKFECSWCGKCCASFGRFIKVERQLNDRDYYCRYGLTGEVFPVHVLPEFSQEFAGTFEDAVDPADKTPQKQCAFMRKNTEGEGFSCIIYPTRPKVCREFRCYRMLVHNRGGLECGRILGRSELMTGDKELIRIWNEEIVPLPHCYDSAWEHDVIDILARHGYRGDPVG